MKKSYLILIFLSVISIYFLNEIKLEKPVTVKQIKEKIFFGKEY